jgi:hypothetical protein
MKSKILYTFLTLCLFTIYSCDLTLQEPYDFKQEVPVIPDFTNLTAYEWLKTDLSPLGLATPEAAKFDYMADAIDRTGMQDVFNAVGPNPRTFLLMQNSAFLGANNIISLVRPGKTKGSLDSSNLVRLKAILQYHVIDAYVDQIKALPEVDKDYFFQTLLPGPNGEINVRRNILLGMAINNTSSFITAQKKGAGVQRHNYVFKNGIGHQMNAYVRKVPFTQ